MPKVQPIPPVDLSAREAHFLDHLAPSWLAIPAHHRGTVYVEEGLENYARSLELGHVEAGYPMRGKDLGPIICAAYGDLKVASRTRRDVVLFEHGAGQSYSTRHRSYIGGKERDRVALFLVPGDAAASRSKRYYPSTKTVTIGSPRVDELRKIEAPERGCPTVAVSFHWRAEAVSPEAGSAIDDFVDELEATAERLREEHGVAMIGHAHPRIADEARFIYERAGIEWVPSFEDVVRRAHVYAVDNSSTLFEFAALDRPVVLLNARAYRRNVDHGLRFWSEADVGIQAAPGELLMRLLEARLDPPEVARSRRAAIARTYSVADGTSADRAAEAIVSLLTKGRTCPVCGAEGSTCGEPTTVTGIDERLKESDPKMGNLKRYRNPARDGAYLKLSDRDAEAMGLLGQHVGAPARREPAPDVTNTGGGMVISTSAPAEPDRPKGALAPSGPTHRARAEADEPPAETVPRPSTRRRRAEP